MQDNTHPTDQEIAGLAKQFLARAQLSGQEVGAFNVVDRLTQHEKPNS